MMQKNNNDNDNSADGNGNRAGGEEIPAPTADSADAIHPHANTIEDEEMEAEAAPDMRSAVVRPTTRNERKKEKKREKEERRKKRKVESEMERVREETREERSKDWCWRYAAEVQRIRKKEKGDRALLESRSWLEWSEWQWRMWEEKRRKEVQKPKVEADSESESEEESEEEAWLFCNGSIVRSSPKRLSTTVVHLFRS